LNEQQKIHLKELLLLQKQLPPRQLAVLFNVYLGVDYSEKTAQQYLKDFFDSSHKDEEEPHSSPIPRMVWDGEKKQYALRLQSEGFAVADISIALNARYGVHTTSRSVSTKLARLRRQLQKEPLKKASTKKASTKKILKESSKKLSKKLSEPSPSQQIALIDCTDQDELFLMELHSQGYTSEEIARELDAEKDIQFSAEQVRNHIREIILKRRRENGLNENENEDDTNVNAILVDQDLRTADARQQVLEYIANANDTLKRFDAAQFFTNVSIPGDKEWQLIIFAGDWHIGSQVIDMRRLMRETQLIADTPDCWYVFVGDASDNFISGGKIKGGQHEQSVPPKLARVAVGALFDLLASKLLAVATGCHDLWSVDVDDYNLVEELSQKHNCAYLGYGGKITLQAGDIVYKMTALHKFRMNSTLNIDHACRRYLQLEDMDNDIIAIAHNHSPFIGLEYMQDRPRALIRTAAYKGLDRYAQRLVFTDGLRKVKNEDKVFMPCVLINTMRHGIRVAHSIPEGIGLLHFLNGLTQEEYQAMYGDAEVAYSAVGE